MSFIRGIASSSRVMATPRQVVDTAIRGNRVVIFSKSYCPYCAKAKRAFNNVGLRPERLTVLELDQRDDGPAIQSVLGELTGGTSVPRVFIDGDFIGGGDDTAAAERSGKLAKLLTDKGILA